MFNGYKTMIYYQKDIKILERYADEEAENYYKKSEGKKDTGYNKGNYKRNNYNKGGYKKEFGYNKYPRENRHNNKFRDNDARSKHEDDATSQHSLSGFGKAAPKFFNKKRNEYDTESLKDVSKSNPIDDRNIETDSPRKNAEKLESIPEDSSQSKTAAIHEDKISKTKEEDSIKIEPVSNKEDQAKSNENINKLDDPIIRRRDTDDQFEIGYVGSIKSTNDTSENKESLTQTQPKTSETESPKTDITNNESKDEGIDETKNDLTTSKTETTKLVNKESDNFERNGLMLKPRHSERGRPSARRPYAIRYGKMPQQRQNDPQSEKESAKTTAPQSTTEKPSDKPVLIGDRPETEQASTRSYKNNYPNFRGGHRRGYHNRGRNRGGYKHYNQGYHHHGNKGYYNDSHTIQYDRMSQYSDRVDIESTHSQKQYKHTYGKSDARFRKTEGYNRSSHYNHNNTKSKSFYPDQDYSNDQNYDKSSVYSNSKSYKNKAKESQKYEEEKYSEPSHASSQPQQIKQNNKKTYNSSKNNKDKQYSKRKAPKLKDSNRFAGFG